MDAKRVADVVMNYRQVSQKPPRVAGLPDLETCQGSEPKLLTHRISPEAARLMAHHDRAMWKERKRAHAA